MTPTSAPAAPRADSSRLALDQAVAAVLEQKRAFARLPVIERIALLQSLEAPFLAASPGWVAAACRAKQIALDAPVAGEEWLAGPAVTARNIRLLTESLQQIARHGRPPLGRKVRTRADGLVEVSVLPAGGWDGTLYKGLSCWVRLQPGIDQAAAEQRQASFYQRRDAEGKVALILGAGNVASIPVMDVLYKMFVEGAVCVLKMNPVNEWLTPFLEQILAPIIARGFLRIVRGAGDVGEYLCQHRDVDEIHITGSDKTHDRIVWGPPGPEQDRRRREGLPVLKKAITSELGNVSPVAIVPGQFTEKELWFQARNLCTMLVNNASFNCNAAKVLITAPGWPQRDRFLELLTKAVGEVSPRVPYYPGARQRYSELVGSRKDVRILGAAGGGNNDGLPWAFIPNLDAGRTDEPLFQVEPFCGVLAHTEVGAADPISFLDTVTSFCNDRLWGTLNATLIIDRRSEGDPTIAAALDHAVGALRYGTVAVNLWPGVCYGSVSPPWGGHPSATLANIQSGLGWVHNTFMLEGIEKSIIRAPSVMAPKPAWYYDNTQCKVIGQKLAAHEIHPRALRIPALVLAALRG
ncbi:MAG TPA: aldehyde dehydrogenase family protein [Polyangia bacterium]|jgi:aldehyde dehydrogenase (NAD(P)+)|nr:aldehyde dehydrogenase family protein [Polyangia bacterium]